MSVLVVTCDPEWQSPGRPHSSSTGGRLLPQPLSESGCRDHCAYDLPGCVAVDIDSNQMPYPACWVHTNLADLDRVYLNRNVMQHRISLTSPPCRVTAGEVSSSYSLDYPQEGLLSCCCAFLNNNFKHLISGAERQVHQE